MNRLDDRAARSIAPGKFRTRHCAARQRFGPGLDGKHAGPLWRDDRGIGPALDERSAGQRRWLTAEYSMLPYSTLTRKPRDISKGRLDGDVLLSHNLSCTTIGAAAFHFRVRNGNGWGHCAMITRKLSSRRSRQISGRVTSRRSLVTRITIQQTQPISAIATISKNS